MPEDVYWDDYKQSVPINKQDVFFELKIQKVLQVVEALSNVLPAKKFLHNWSQRFYKTQRKPTGKQAKDG